MHEFYCPIIDSIYCVDHVKLFDISHNQSIGEKFAPEFSVSIFKWALYLQRDWSEKTFIKRNVDFFWP